MKPHPLVRSGLSWLLLGGLAFVVPALRAAEGAPAKKIPVIFHTDIGTDIDDTWALAYLLRSPEFDLKLVLVDTGDPVYRAKVAAKELEAAGRTDVPIALGADGNLDERDRNQAPWVKDYALDRYPGEIARDGVAKLIATVRASPEPVTIISVGAVPALAEALRREPAIARKAKFVGMFGSIHSGYGGNVPVAEANVKGDPAGLRAVLAAPWLDALITPLDTCGVVSLSGANYRAVWNAVDDPLVRAVIEGYCIFAPRVWWMKCDFFTSKSTTLYDCVAVYLARSEAWTDVKTMHLAVTDDGFTREDPAAPAVRVALRWKDQAAFEADIARRLVGSERR